MNTDTIKYTTRTELLSLIPDNAILAEIGVFKGEFAKEIIKRVKFKKLYLVDIWQGSWGSGDKDGENYLQIENMEDVYLNLFKQAEEKEDIHIIRAGSVPFLTSRDNNFFDAIYVDGDHEEQAVYNDLVLSLAKIKPNGLLMGHDYHHQIKIAVDRFCADYNQTISGIAEDGCPSFVINVRK